MPSRRPSATGIAPPRGREPSARNDIVRPLSQVRVTLLEWPPEPSIEAASALALYEAAELIGKTLSEALGREHGDLEIQLLSHALVGAITGAIHHWYESGFARPLGELLQRALDSLDRGFRFAD